MSETCSICLDSNFVDSTTHDKRKFITKCNHVFHHDCIYRWAQQNNSCPTCRTGNLIDEFIIMNYNYHDSDYDSDYDSILSSIRNVRLNLGNFIDDNNNNFELINLPLIQNHSNSTSNNVIILPNNPPTSEVVNLRMGLNNSRRQRTNHRLGSMNFRQNY